MGQWGHNPFGPPDSSPFCLSEKEELGLCGEEAGLPKATGPPDWLGTEVSLPPQGGRQGGEQTQALLIDSLSFQ